MATELWKQRVHRGLTPRLFHWRETRGVEVDLVVDDEAILWLVEAKSGATVANDWFPPLLAALAATRAENPGRDVRACLLYGGDEESARHEVRIVPWHQIGSLAPVLR